MTAEQRLDRLERIAKLFVRAGLRERRSRRLLDEKINIVINSQIRNEERFARNEERFAQLADAQARMYIQLKELAESQNALAIAQKDTDERLKVLVEIVGRDHKGNR